jgi:hypothetical protein
MVRGGFTGSVGGSLEGCGRGWWRKRGLRTLLKLNDGGRGSWDLGMGLEGFGRLISWL